MSETDINADTSPNANPGANSASGANPNTGLDATAGTTSNTVSSANEVTSPKGTGASTAGFVLGLDGILLMVCGHPILGCICAVIGLFLSWEGMQNNLNGENGHGLAVAGFILSLIVLACALMGALMEALLITGTFTIGYW